MRRVTALAVLLFGFTIKGQGTHSEPKTEVLDVLKAATNVVLYSLDPNRMDPKEPSTLTGYRILIHARDCSGSCGEAGQPVLAPAHKFSYKR
jgi:hypothetical protein